MGAYDDIAIGWWKLLALAVSTIVLLATPSVAGAAAGDLDPSFNGIGFNATSVPGQAFALAIQSDGRILVGGEGTRLARYNPDGSLESIFGGSGPAIADLAVQPDGGIVTVATLEVFSGGPYSIVVTRSTANGSPDSSFGSSGVATIRVGGQNAFGTSLALQPDGKIVVGGGTPNPIFGETSPDFALARLTPSGALDPTFGSGGTVRTDFDTGRDLVTSVLVQPDGKIVAGGAAAIGFSFSDFALARYTSDGSLDPTFGVSNGVVVAGQVTTNFPGGSGGVTDVVLQSDGKLATVGEIGDLSSTTIPSSDIGLARYDAVGMLDPAFGIGGTRHIDFGPGLPGIGTNEALQAAVIQPDGKLVAAGARSDNGDSAASFMVTRFMPDGSFDASFGAGGVVTTSLLGSDAAFDIARQPDGRIVASGFASDPLSSVVNFGVARYLTDSPEARLEALRSSVSAAGLGHGLTRSLEVKLRGGATACRGLRAFANEVRALSGNKIPTPTASDWLSEAESIRIALGC